MPIESYTLEQAEEDISELRAEVDRLGEAHSVTDGGTQPNTPDPNTHTVYNTAGQPAYINPSGLAVNLSGSDLAVVAPVIVTQASAQTVASFFVPGGDSAAGSVYSVTTFGFGTTGSTGASNVLTCNLTHGGVGGGAQSAGSSLFGISQAFRWWIQAYLVCISPGAGGQFFSYATFNLAQAGSNILPTGVQAVAIPTGTSSSFTVDSTTGETFRAQLNWAATTGGPTLTAVASFGGKVA